MKSTARTALLGASVSVGLVAFTLEIVFCKMHLLDGQSLLYIYCTDDDKIGPLIESNRNDNSRDGREAWHIELNRLIQQRGCVKKLDAWVPHGLEEIHLSKCINICDALSTLSCFQETILLNRMMTVINNQR